MATDADFKVKIKEASLFVRKAKLSPSVQLAHMKALEKSTAKYPIRRVETKIFSIPKGNLTANQENVFLGQQPQKVILGLVQNAAFNGTFAKSPYDFATFDANFIALYKDGQQIPAKPLQPNYADGQYIRSYLSLFCSTGQIYQDEGNHLSRQDYAEGYTLYAFDLTPDLADGNYLHVVKQGNLRVELHFAHPLPETVNCLVLAEFESIIEVDRSRNILFDYSA